MFSFPMSMHPENVGEELIDMSRRAVEGIKMLGGLHEDDVQVGASEKEAVYQDDHVVLYRYKPLVDTVFHVPVLISYALVNRPYMVDLQEDRSLVRNLLQQGLDVYLIDWGYPQRNDRWITLDDYINGYIDGCVDFIRESHAIDSIDLIGICQGGVLGMCYTALNPHKIKNLITMITPVDFHVTDGMINTWMGSALPSSSDIMNPDLMVEALGNIPGELMNFGFLMLKPFELGLQKYLGLMDMLDNPAGTANFLRMEKWIFDSPDQVGETWKQFIRDFYLGNKLVKGEVEIGGERVDLGNITMPVLNLYAEKDHLVPPSSSVALEKYVGTQDYTVKSFPVGHVGMYVSGRVQDKLPATLVEWIKARG